MEIPVLFFSDGSFGLSARIPFMGITCSRFFLCFQVGVPDVSTCKELPEVLPER